MPKRLVVEVDCGDTYCGGCRCQQLTPSSPEGRCGLFRVPLQSDTKGFLRCPTCKAAQMLEDPMVIAVGQVGNG